MDEKSTVVAFKIPSIDDPRCTNVRNFHIKEFEEIKKQIDVAKASYDGPYNKDSKRFYYIIRQFEHASTFRQEVHMKYNTPNVSNAWLKAYELFEHYNVFPSSPIDKFMYFDNAAFPGSFILAAWHYVNTKCDINDFQWRGSSFLSEKDELMGGAGLLEDKYNLYKNYPDNWLMNENNNGDVLQSDNQKEWENAIGGTIDLYTSDLGFDVSQDYNKQEELHAHANLGQIITALLVLKKGGTMITKQYSYFEPFTVSLMGLLTRVFDSVEICKPMFSKSGNSETYLVGLGYKAYGINSKYSITKILLSRLNNWNMKPLTTKGCLGNSFLSAIINSQKYFADKQLLKLTNIISEYKRYVKSKNTDRKHIANTNMFKEQNISDLEKWIRCNTIEPLPVDIALDVSEVMVRKYRDKKSSGRSGRSGAK
jgi:hypothetical protein